MKKQKCFRGSTSTQWYSVYLIPGQIGILKCWFLRRGENRGTQRKPFGARENLPPPPKKRLNKKINQSIID